MAYGLKATCKCGYESAMIRIGDGSSFIATCNQCREIVNPRRPLFRLVTPPCNLCGALLEEKDFLKSGSLHFNEESATPCPKCGNRKIIFKNYMHMRLVHGPEFPSAGDEIDGYLKSRGGTLEVPNLPLSSATIVHDIPADTPAKKNFTMKVLSIQTGEPTGTVEPMFYKKVVSKIELQFVKFIDEQGANSEQGGGGQPATRPESK